MKPLALFSALFIILSSCKDITPTENVLKNSGIPVAENIIYDVIIRAETDDPWENEKVAGYEGEEMVDKLFEAIYAKSIKVTDYHTGNSLSVADVKEIEKQVGFGRENIGKLQFTEDWFFNTETLVIDKRVKSVVFGYRSGSADVGRIGYLAAFKLELQ